MAWYRSLFYLLPELWRTIIRPRITVRFPFAPPEIPPYFRGKVTIDPDLCRGCGRCVRDCPATALELSREGRGFRLIHYRDRCAYCGQCEESCPHGAVRLVPDFEPAAPDRELLKEIMVEKLDKAS